MNSGKVVPYLIYILTKVCIKEVDRGHSKSCLGCLINSSTVQLNYEHGICDGIYTNPEKEKRCYNPSMTTFSITEQNRNEQSPNMEFLTSKDTATF